MLFRILPVLLILVSAVSLAEETAVRIDNRVDGKLMLPEDEPVAAVLLLHGWNSQMNEVGDMYAILAAELASRSIASLRINFNGEGRQNNYVVTMTCQSRISEALLAFDYLQQAVAVDHYGVVGFSLGGLTTLSLIGHHPDGFDSVVLWSAAETMRTGEAYGDSYNRAVREAMLEGEATYMDFTEITLTREFLASFIGVNVGSNLAQYNGALLTIRGSNDFLPSADRRWLELTPSRDKEFVLIGDTDHTFNIFDDTKPGRAAAVIEKTARWLGRTLR